MCCKVCLCVQFEFCLGVEVAPWLCWRRLLWYAEIFIKTYTCHCIHVGHIQIYFIIICMNLEQGRQFHPSCDVFLPHIRQKLEAHRKRRTKSPSSPQQREDTLMSLPMQKRGCDWVAIIYSTFLSSITTLEPPNECLRGSVEKDSV